MISNELTYWVTFASMPTMWTKRKMEIYVACFNKGLSIVDLFEDEALWNELQMSEEERVLFADAKKELPNNSFLAEDLLSQGYDIIPVTSSDYPAILKSNLKYNSPIVVYTKGDKRLLQQDSVAIVGSRSATAQALDFTTKVAENAVKQDYPVVSGFAKGVDRQALDAAVNVGGKSVIVLPQGICTFAGGFRQYYKPISQGKVLVLSPYHPKAPWSVAFAMARNPIIYAMASKIYVAQSDSTGGTWEGVIDGLRKKREIYVRYPEANEKNANMLLIQKGAIPVDAQGEIMTLSEDAFKSPEEKAKDKINELLTPGVYLSSREINEKLSLGLSDAQMKKLLRSMDGIAESKDGRTIKFYKSQELSLF